MTQRFPKLIVFDLDMCLWSPEMYELEEIPRKEHAVIGKLSSEGVEGVVGVRSGHEVIRLFDDARAILRDFHEGKFPEYLRIAAASSADTPRAVQIGRAAMSILEIAPGVTMRQVFARGWPEGFEGNLQIGRTPPLSSDKAATHFPILQRETNVDYKDMVFLDDCNWGDHVSNVYRAHGVVGQRTPRGLTRREWDLCLASFRKERGEEL
jgi:magnesium-dependent phosphatase 1